MRVAIFQELESLSTIAIITLSTSTLKIRHDNHQNIKFEYFKNCDFICYSKIIY